MPQRSQSFSYRALWVLALALMIAGCTKSGQFDPTDWFNSDVFDSKKKLKGERQPVFPEGVPGATSGVPADLVKGYEPPPDQPENGNAAVAGPTPPSSVTEADKPKAKPKPRPKVAAQKPATPATPTTSGASGTRISVGPKSAPGQQSDPGQSVWPAPPQQAAQTQPAWPAPPPPPQTPAQRAQSSQSIWPDPPPPVSPR